MAKKENVFQPSLFNFQKATKRSQFFPDKKWGEFPGTEFVSKRKKKFKWFFFLLNERNMCVKIVKYCSKQCFINVKKLLCK